MPALGRSCRRSTWITLPDSRGFPGSFEFGFASSTGGQNNIHEIRNLSIQTANRAPTAVNDSYSTNEDTQLNVAAPGVLQNDTDPDNDALTAQLVNGPSNGRVTLNKDGSFNYTPNENFNGNDSFTYRTSDGQAQSQPATVNITVNPANDPPAIDLNGGRDGAGYRATFTEGNGPAIIVDEEDLAVTDVDNENLASATATLTNRPDGNAESLSVNTDGTQITANYNQQTGQLRLTGPATKAEFQRVLRTVRYNNTSNNPNPEDRRVEFVVNDGTDDSNVAVSTVSIQAVNNPPDTVDDSYQTDEDTTLTVQPRGVLENDTDPDSPNDAITAALESEPSNGTVTLRDDGSFEYTPNENFTGEDSFTYTASDGRDRSAPATVTITVAPVNDPPTARNDSAATDEDTPAVVDVLENDSAGPPNESGQKPDGRGDHHPATEWHGRDHHRRPRRR